MFVNSAAVSLASAEPMSAVVTREPSAALVSFQRKQPGFLPPQNVISADTRETLARQFGGINAKSANNLQILQKNN